MITITTDYYSLECTPDARFILKDNRGYLILGSSLSMDVNCIDVPGQKKIFDKTETVSAEEFLTDSGFRGIRITCTGSQWNKKTLYLECREESLEFYAVIEGQGASLDTIVFFPEEAEAGSDLLYAPRFDWSRGIVHTDMGAKESLSCHQWLSPPPFYYGLRLKSRWIGVGLKAEEGQNNFLSFDYDGAQGPEFSLSYEGHTRIDGRFKTPVLTLYTTGTVRENDGLFRYTDDLEREGCIRRKTGDIPAWWREPIFCGWGQQRLDYRRDHDGHESGSWINAGDYSTQLFYEKNLSVLEDKGIEPGIVIIDCFWAEKPGFAGPHPLRWPDMRGFIDSQHNKGRKVLLWFTPIIFEGLPDDYCMSLEGKPVAADPTSPAFRQHMDREVRKMLGSDPGCLNADGFKIDFTQDIPSERGVFRNILNNRWAIISEEEDKNYSSIDKRTHSVKMYGDSWGVELIKEYLSCIRSPMKDVKAESLLITHTANPYFAGDVDMIRLNDMDGTSPDVLGIMSNRAAIAKSCNPSWLIDTDNDLMINKNMWREYIALQAKLGNPDTYYATGIAQSGESFTAADYALLRESWETYRQQLAEGCYAGEKIQ